MELSLITNDPELAQYAEELGVDRILIDLETYGKAERQSGRNLFLSDHSIHDVRRMRRVLQRTKLMVRVDSPNLGSAKKIASVIDEGADMIMLPYFQRLDEAKDFLGMVGDKASPILLVETREAAETLEDLAALTGLSEIHIGLNDLSISYGLGNLFDIISSGVIDPLCSILRASGIPFGFGGIGCLDRSDLPVPPGWMLAEQVCQGATRGWLGRTFRECDPSRFKDNIRLIRYAIDYWKSADSSEKEKMSRMLRLHLATMPKP